MSRVSNAFLCAALMVLACGPRFSRAVQLDPQRAQELYDRVTPSLVAVRYVFQNELMRRELTGSGVIVSADGLVMAPLGLMFNENIPDQQMKEFKILVPREDGEPQEFAAIFQGRDERTNMAFLKTREPQHWKAIQFEDLAVKIGEPILSVGMLPKSANYKTYYMDAGVAAMLRGELPQVLVNGGGLAAFGAPVFNADGKAVGIVGSAAGPGMLLDEGREQELGAVMSPPRFFTPARDFLLSLSDPPTPDKPIALPWMGIAQMQGVSKDVAEVMDLGTQPAIQIGDVIPDAPADKAGLKAGDIIVKINGKDLERGDEPAELPGILQRRLARLKPGEKITLSILREKGEPVKDVEVTLGKQPKRANLAKRYYAEDLGFVARELVFGDIYQLKLPSDKGVIVALLRPQAAAQTGGLRMNDVITRLDNEPVTDVQEFEKDYNKIRKDKPKDAIVLEVRRGDRQDTVRIEPPQ